VESALSAGPGPAAEPEPEPEEGRDAPPEGRPGPPPWNGPWLDDAQRLFRVLQAAAEQIGADESLAALRRSAPDLLDRVADVAADLADALRRMDAEPDRAAQPPPGNAPGPVPGTGTSVPARPPSTVRIDVTD
jgi:hypothetical protein